MVSYDIHLRSDVQTYTLWEMQEKGLGELVGDG